MKAETLEQEFFRVSRINTVLNNPIQSKSKADYGLGDERICRLEETNRQILSTLQLLLAKVETSSL